MSREDKQTLEKLYRLLCQTRYTQTALLEHKKLKYTDFGEEAITVGALEGLRADDLVSVYFRSDKAVIKYKLGLSVAEHMAFLMDKKTDPNTVPREGHCYPDKGLVGKSSSCIGGDVDMCCGAALAQKMMDTGRVVLFFAGDGAVSKGNYHEVFNFAALQKLPIIFMVRHNEWAMSTPLSQDINVERIAQVGAAFGIPSREVDGNDAVAVKNAVAQVAELVRGGHGPYLIEAMTYRMSPHSGNDEDDYYRDENEKAAWAKKDPVLNLERRMTEAGFGENEVAAIKQEVMREVESAFCWADALPRLTPEEMMGRQQKAVAKMLGRA